MIQVSAEDKKYLDTAKPGDRAVYVNMDAIRELPEQFEAVITKVLYDKNKLENDFSNVGSRDTPSWMPDPQLMYKIAEAKGISGISGSSESIVEEVDINPMLRKAMDASPTTRKMVVGKRVTKQSFVIQDDGTERHSSLCTTEYNVWERCMELWSKEEAFTDGYTKEGKFPTKYDTMYKRRAHFDAEMKFAQPKAETKANLKTIRELAGMMTGFAPDDLKTGFLIFSRVRRSSDSLKVEAAAMMSKGAKATAALFQAPPVAPDPVLQVFKLIQAFEDLKNMDGVPKVYQTRVDGCLGWLKSAPVDDLSSWDKSVNLYAEVVAGQEGFPGVEEFRV